MPGESSEPTYLEAAICSKEVTVFAANDLKTPIASFCLFKGRTIGTTLYLESGLYFIRVKSKPFSSEVSSYTISISPGQF